MTERFMAWVMVRAQQDQFRLSMALMGVFLIIGWASLGLWPVRLQIIGRRAYLIGGGLIYAALLAVALCTLVWTLFVGR